MSVKKKTRTSRVCRHRFQELAKDTNLEGDWYGYSKTLEECSLCGLRRITETDWREKRDVSGGYYLDKTQKQELIE